MSSDILEQEGDAAADYLEALLDIADLDGDIDIDVEGSRAQVSIVEANQGELKALVGKDGKVLEALQELARLAATRETGERSRLMLDVAGFRSARKDVLTGLAQTAIAQVQQSGEPVALEPMNAFERKVIHDEVAKAGLTSSSDGEEPQRHVVVSPSA